MNIADGVDCDWMVVCVEYERQRRRWTHFAEEMSNFFFADDFDVDAIHVLQVLFTYFH